ncbi:phage terminase small subunit [Methyloversatilis sp.]|uniref:phage terminase small subunit n=1 Tax=Methyloversatilis sp. TaxID=2569862 RepID=UPI00273315C6|nr:phage terminase small subunit [Methyloversatilis sp.]MDP3579153.1 phage terminase small subunit [Methyloversatilis sp.]
MTLSPARAHRMRCIAAAVATVASAQAIANGTHIDPSLVTGYELVLAQLDEHRRQLKQIQSIANKAEAKRRFLPEYAAYVGGALQADRGGQDDVIMTIMVWRLDVADYTGALHIAEYALRHGLTLPDQYKRDLPTLIAEELAEAAFKSRSSGTAFDTGVLLAGLQLTAERDMPDEVRAKLHKAIAYTLRDHAELQAEPATLEQLQQIRSHLTTALALHAGAGVKKDIERMDTKIKALTPADSTEKGQTKPPAASQDGAG